MDTAQPYKQTVHLQPHYKIAKLFLYYFFFNLNKIKVYIPFSIFKISHSETIRPHLCITSWNAFGRLLNGKKIMIECTDIHIRTQSMRTQWRIWGRILTVSTIAQSPVLMAIIVSGSPVPTCMNALYIFRGRPMIRWYPQIKSRPSHVTCCEHCELCKELLECCRLQEQIWCEM